MKHSGLVTTQHGSSLIEVLVTLALLSTGLLGAAMLQIFALRSNQEGAMLGQAAVLANSMAERIRANPAGLDGGTGYTIEHGQIVPLAPDCLHDTCSSDELARYDLAQWKDELASALVSGDGEISATLPVVSIIVRWDQDRTGASGQRCPPVDISDLRCFRLDLEL